MDDDDFENAKGEEDDVDVEGEEGDDVEENRSQDRPGSTLFARACADDMCIGISQKPFCMENYTENAGREPWGRGSVRPCTAEMRMDFSQKEIYRELAGHG